MKHKVTVEVETTKHFLGIPYKSTEKKRITVDGKTYRKMQREEQERLLEIRERDEEIISELEEELVDIYGEDF